MNQRTLELSPISAWADGELVELPSKRVYRLRQLDVLSVMGEDGNVPNFLLPLISGQKSNVEASPADILALGPLLNRIASQSVVEPAIVPDMEAVKRNEGITLSMIPMQDKMAMLNYAMGGQAAVSAAMRFQQKQSEPLAVVPDKKERITEHAVGD
jgi:hypothetical protein